MKIATIVCYALSVMGTLFLSFVWFIGGVSVCAGLAGSDSCRTAYNAFQWVYLIAALAVPLAVFVWALRSRSKTGPLVTALITEITLPIVLFAILAMTLTHTY